MKPTDLLMEQGDRNHIPTSALIEITWRCNLKCVHCYLPEGVRRKSASAADELSTEEWKRTLDQLAEAGVLYLTITGGEVGLRPDFLDIARHAREREFDVRVFTTGTLLNDQTAQALVDLEIGRVEISVYGMEETHDKVVRIPGAFQRSMKAAKKLSEGGIFVVIKCPLMKLNFKDYLELIKLALKNGWGHKFDPTLVPQDDGNSAPTEYRLSDQELLEAFNDPQLNFKPQGDAKEDHIMASPMCEAGRTYAAIGPNGDVYPCIEWRTVLGNIRTKSFRDIWQNGKAKKIYDLKPQDFPICNQCDLLPYCPRCTGLADREDGSPMGASQMACHLAKLNFRAVHNKDAPDSALDLFEGGKLTLTAAEMEMVKKAPSDHHCTSCSSGGCGAENSSISLLTADTITPYT